MKVGDVVSIEWVDSQAFEGWRDKDDATEIAKETERLTIQTIGFLIHQDKFSITVAHSTSASQYCGRITIPQGAVTSIKRVKV